MNSKTLSKKLTEMDKCIEILCEDIQNTITRLTSDLRLVKNNYKSGPMFTYYTFIDMAGYCLRLIKKIETGAEAYKIVREYIEDKE